MFWGLTLEPGKKYSQTVEETFHISMAAIEPSTGQNDIVSVVVNYEDEEHILCSLSKNILQQSLDLNFAEGTQVSFHTTGGKAKIHLTGYVMPEGDDEGDFGDFEEGDEEMEDEEHDMEEEEAEEEEEEEVKPGKRKLPAKEEKKAAAVAASPKEDAAAESPSKKSKKDKKKKKAEAAQENKAAEANGTTPAKPAAAAATPSPKKRKLAGGLMVEDLKEGNGKEAKKGQNVSVYYSGRLQSNNKEFDKTVKGPGFKFRLGAGEVIKGWDVGVEGMKVGGKRKLTIPAHMAYGPKGSPPAIPPNSTLVFDVELKGVH